MRPYFVLVLALAACADREELRASYCRANAVAGACNPGGTGGGSGGSGGGGGGSGDDGGADAGPSDAGYLLVRQMGGPGQSVINAMVVIADNIWVGGKYKGEVDFGGIRSPGNQVEWVGFVARYHLNGELQTLIEYPNGFGDTDTEVTALTKASQSDDVVVGGNFANAIAVTGLVWAAKGNGDAFIAEYTPMGSRVRARHFAATSPGDSVRINALTSSAGRLAVAGSYLGTFATDGGTGQNLPDSGSDEEGFVVFLDATFAKQPQDIDWDTQSTGGATVLDIVTDGTDCYALGSAVNAVTFDGPLLGGPGQNVRFLKRFVANTTSSWDQQVGRKRAYTSSETLALGDGGLYVGGNALGPIEDKGAARPPLPNGDAQPLLMSAQEAGFVARVGAGSSGGNVLWADPLTSGFNPIHGLLDNGNGQLFAVGSFRDTVVRRFPGGASVVPYSGAGTLTGQRIASANGLWVVSGRTRGPVRVRNQDLAAKPDGGDQGFLMLLAP